MNNYLFRYCLKPRQFKKENWQVPALPMLCLKYQVFKTIFCL